MKNFVIGLIIIAILGATGLGLYLWQTGQNPLFWQTPNSETEVIEDEELTEINEILNNASGLEDLEEVLPGTESPVVTRLPVKQSLKTVQLFENPFIRFSYPSYISFKSQSLNFIEVLNQEVLIGTMNIYSNPEELSLEEFSQKENIVDYFTESQKQGTSFEVFDIPTAKRAVKFANYQELQIADVYLIELNQIIVIAKDFSEDDVIGEYLLKSIEKSQ